MAFTIEADNAVEAAGAERFRSRFRISLPMWANGLRVINEDGVTVADVQSRALASCNLGGLERWGWITVGDKGPARRPGYGSQRAIRSETVLRPTVAGSAARRLWPSIVTGVEAAWKRRFGTAVIAALRRSAGSRRPMPWAPPEVHPSDGFYSHITPGSARPEHRPLVVLLGQVLTSLTLDAEGALGVSLPIVANLLRVVGTSPVSVRDLPVRAGVSKEAVAMGVNYLTRAGLGEVVPQRAVRLTPAGHGALERYRAHRPRPEPPGLRAALLAVLSRPDALATGLVPPDGCWRGERPYRAQTDRLLADPLGTLPWHPMVLHRGGWPDGS